MASAVQACSLIFYHGGDNQPGIRIASYIAWAVCNYYSCIYNYVFMKSVISDSMLAHSINSVYETLHLREAGHDITDEPGEGGGVGGMPWCTILIFIWCSVFRTMRPSSRS